MADHVTPFPNDHKASLEGSLKVQDVAGDLAVHKKTVYRMIRRGDIKAHRVGKNQLRITVAELNAYKERSVVRPETAVERLIQRDRERLHKNK